MFLARLVEKLASVKALLLAHYSFCSQDKLSVQYSDDSYKFATPRSNICSSMKS